MQHAGAVEVGFSAWLQHAAAGFFQRQPTAEEKARRAAILALAHCYHARLNSVKLRGRYLRCMASVFRVHGHLGAGQASDLRALIEEEQRDYLQRMARP